MDLSFCVPVSLSFLEAHKGWGSELVVKWKALACFPESPRASPSLSAYSVGTMRPCERRLEGLSETSALLAATSHMSLCGEGLQVPEETECEGEEKHASGSVRALPPSLLPEVC